MIGRGVSMLSLEFVEIPWFCHDGNVDVLAKHDGSEESRLRFEREFAVRVHGRCMLGEISPIDITVKVIDAVLEVEDEWVSWLWCSTQVTPSKVLSSFDKKTRTSLCRFVKRSVRGLLDNYNQNITLALERDKMRRSLPGGIGLYVSE